MSGSDRIGTAASPAATRGRSGSTGSETASAHRQEAWQREMERAQLAAWFKPQAPTPGQASASARKAAAAPSPAPRKPPQAHGLPDPGSRAGQTTDGNQASPASMGAHGVSGQAAEFGLPTAPAMAPSMAAPALRVGGVVGAPDTRTTEAAPLRPQALAVLAPRAEFPPEEALQTDPAVAEDASAAPEPTALSADDGQPLRLHAELRPEGRAVWIAMRADDSALQAVLPRIVADLERGYRLRDETLHQVVCNGRLVWRDGRFVPGADRASSRSDPPSAPIQPRSM